MATKETCQTFLSRALSNTKNQKIVNPETGRPITLYKETFNDLANRCSLYNQCRALRGPTNINGFTCYLDSVFMVLLAMKNKFIHKYILFQDISGPPPVCHDDPEKNVQGVVKLQTELRRLALMIRSGHHLPDTMRVCRRFLTDLKKHCRRRLGTVYATFFEQVQNSASDFLAFLFNVFQFSEAFSIRLLTINRFKRNISDTSFALVHQTENDKVSCVWMVPNEDLVRPAYLRSFLVQTSTTVLAPSQAYYQESDTGRTDPMLFYQKTSFWEKIPPYFVMELGRVSLLTGEFSTTKIIPNKTINRRSLFGVIVHLGYTPASPFQGFGVSSGIGSGHYIAYLRCGDDWYRYDDLQSTLTRVGSYRELVQKTEVTTHGVLYFYSL